MARKGYVYIRNDDGDTVRNDDGVPIRTSLGEILSDDGELLTDTDGIFLTDRGLLFTDNGEVVTYNGEVVTYNGEPVTYNPIETRSHPSLLIKTVIIAGEKTSEGQLIEAVAIPWFEIIFAMGKDPQLAYQLSPRTWEEMIAAAYKHAGFDEVILTPSSGDLGRDVIAVKKGLGTVRVIDQVKAYKPGHLVTANDVRALLGVLESDGASKGFLTTTSDFAPKLREDRLITPHMPSRIELINGETLFKNLKQLANTKH